jgi:hypothetical protein
VRQLGGRRQDTFHQDGQNHHAGDEVAILPDHRQGEFLERHQDGACVVAGDALDRREEVVFRHAQLHEMIAKDAGVPRLVDELRGEELHRPDVGRAGHDVRDGARCLLLGDSPEGKLVHDRGAQRPLAQHVHRNARLRGMAM